MDQIPSIPKPKRKYTKRKDKDAKNTQEKKPSTRGRKKKENIVTFSIEQIADFMVSLYPHLNPKRTDIMEGLKEYWNGRDPPNVLDILEHPDGMKYYKDNFGNIFDVDAHHVGQYIDDKIYFHNMQVDTYDDDYKELIDLMEKKTC
jgi:hypothetical protein